MTMHDQMAGTRDDPLQGAPAGPEDGGKMATAKQAAADTAQDVKATAREDAADVARQARSEASRLMEQAKQEAQRQADERGRQAVQRLRTFSEQLTALSEGRTEQAGPLVGYAERAKTQMQTWADRIEQRGPQAIVEDVAGFARRRPGMFLVAAAGAGFAIGRLVRAERDAQQQPSSMRSNGRTGDVYGYMGDQPLMLADEAMPLGSAGTVGSPTAAAMIPGASDV
jgi:hypothetical protein